MRKRIIQKLTMLALIVMASIPAFAQGGKFGSETNAGVATTIGFHPFGTVFDYKELKLEVTSESPYMVEVIGFSDAVKADPSLLDGSDENFVENTLVIPHMIVGGGGEPTTIFEGVRADAFKTVDADLVSMITSLRVDYNSSCEVTMAIGENAFAGLTDLEEVQCFNPNGYDIPVSAFDEDTYIYAALKLPSGTGVAKSYSKATGWHEFLLRYIGTKLMGDSDANGKIKTSDVNDLKDLILDDEYDEMFDFDGNGKLQSADLNFLKNIVLSL